MGMKKHVQVSILLLLLILLHSECKEISNPSLNPVPVPNPWPTQFHSVLYMNLTDSRLQITNLWYDWVKGRNVNIMQKQLGKLWYDVEWNNGTSFYFTLEPEPEPECNIVDFGVGIPRPDFLDGAVYLGVRQTDGFNCHVWEKVDFIWYYQDIASGRPVRWDFYDGIITHVITFEIGAVLEDSVIQAPAYCFNKEEQQSKVAQTNSRISFLRTRI